MNKIILEPDFFVVDNKVVLDTEKFVSKDLPPINLIRPYKVIPTLKRATFKYNNRTLPITEKFNH